MRLIGNGPIDRWRVVLVLLACLSPVLMHAQDVPECRVSGYLERFGPYDATVSGPASCELVAEDVIRWNGNTRRFRAIHLRGSAISDRDAFIARFHETAAAASAAMSRMGGNIDIDNVTIFLTGTLSPRMGGPGWEYVEGVAGAITFSPSYSECPVSYYKSTVASSEAHFVDAMVHELFHCIQYKHWGDIGSEYWLTEGSAEYFVYLARPSRGPDDIQSFDASIGTQSLAEMTYQAAPFFLWLGSAYGPPRVREFVFSRSTIEGMIPLDMWISFGQAYFDQSIHMPDGSAMPSSPTVGSQSVRASGAIAFGPTPAYTLSARDLHFEEHHLYRISYPPMPPYFRMTWRKLDSGGAWSDPVTDVAACDAPQHYRVMLGATRYAPIRNSQVTATAAGAGACECPAGTWQETPQSTRHFFEQSAMPGGASKRYVGGSRTLRLNPDFTGSFSYDSVEVITGEGTDFKLEQIQTGVSQFTWRIVDGMILTFLRPGTNLLTLNNTITSPGGTLHETRTAAIQSIGHKFSCDAGGLHLTVAPHTPSYLPPGFGSTFSVDLDFSRIGR